MINIFFLIGQFNWRRSEDKCFVRNTSEGVILFFFIFNKHWGGSSGWLNWYIFFSRFVHSQLKSLEQRSTSIQMQRVGCFISWTHSRIHNILSQCWPTVCDSKPALAQSLMFPGILLTIMCLWCMSGNIVVQKLLSVCKVKTPSLLLFMSWSWAIE